MPVKTVAPAPPDPRIVDECRAFLTVPGRTLEDAYAVGFTPAEVDAAVMGGGAQLPKPQTYPPDHPRYGEVHPQQMFLDSEADIVIFGGAAGGGKTFGVFLDSVRDIDNKAYRFVYFRRQQTDINKNGGPFDKSMQFYPLYGAQPNLTNYKWKFPSGAEGQFASLQYDKNVLDWQTSEIDAFYFDELTHFTEAQFWYMISRLRSMAGVKKRLRAGTNPDGASWVKRIIAPWVDSEWNRVTYRADGSTYHAEVPEPGEIRYIARDPNDDDKRVIWVDEDWRYPAESNGNRPKPKSITFVPSKLDDNIKLQEADPDYISNLLMQDAVNAAQLLRGDWNVRRGSFFSEFGSDPKHVITAPYVGALPSNWIVFGGLDANGISKAAFVLKAMDEDGGMHTVESIFREGMTPTLFCGEVCACLARWGVDRKRCSIAADPAMFTDNNRRDIVGEADIECYWRAGLICFEANNNRLHGWSRYHEWLQAPGKYHVWLGYNAKMLELFPQMKHDPVRPGDMLKKDMDDDLFDADRYAIMTRPKPAGPEPAVTTATSSIQQYLVGHKRGGRGGYA